ncbi:MAG: glycosyl transferase family protein [Pseudomonadota bacterium]
MTALAPYVRILGRGPGRARHLTEDEAEAALSLILAGEAAPEATGALLMLMRYRGESAAEIAGFTRALRAALPPWPGPAPALDWPSYAAGRSRGLPFFLLAARLVARAGLPVLLHGWNSHQGTGADVREALGHAGIERARSLDDASHLLARDAIAYLPLEAISSDLLSLLRLRDTLGLRSCLNTVARMANPAAAPLSVQGVFHPPYRELQRDAAILLGQRRSMTIKGGGGEFERHPCKVIEVVGQTGTRATDESAPPLLHATVRLADGPAFPPEPARLADLWDGRLRDPFAEACVIGTAALVLRGAGQATSDADATRRAEALWAGRLQPSEKVPA